MAVTDMNGNECTDEEMWLVRENSAAARLERVLSPPELVRLVRMTYTIEGFGAEQAIKGFPWLRYLGADPAAAVEQALAAIREDEKLKEQLLELRD